MLGKDVETTLNVDDVLRDLANTDGQKRDNEAASPISGQICIPIGNDTDGNIIKCDVTRFPHLLIGGTTGSGKTAFIHSLIAKMITTKLDNQLRFIFFDSKGIDYTEFNGLPSLLVPIITDAQKALGAIGWIRSETVNRMKLFAENACKDIEAYNSKNAAIPYIIVVFDDFAELSLYHGSDVIEEALASILSTGRRVGIHFIIATSTPTTKIITKTFKAIIPSRISFAVPAKELSILVLDGVGAERLKQQGEFIIKSVGLHKKGKCVYMDDEEINRIVTAIKKSHKLSFESLEEKRVSAFDSFDNTIKSEDDISHDAMLPNAIEVVIESGMASTSLIQRRLKLGYARAARLIDMMEERGIVGPFKGAKLREILITRQQWDAMKSS